LFSADAAAAARLEARVADSASQPTIRVLANNTSHTFTGQPPEPLVTTNKATATVVMAAAAAGGRIDVTSLARQDAAPVAGQIVVVHVSDYRGIAPRDLRSAEQLAVEVYRAIGVQVIWTDELSDPAQPDGSFHVHVVLLSRAMTVMKCQEESLPDSTLGRATKPSRRAWIFYDRIADHAARVRSAVSHPLAIVLAHEIGHLLLPTYSHSPSGIMRADVEGSLVRVPKFTNEQGAAIRGLLAAPHAN
jgi:hypothetical protein